MNFDVAALYALYSARGHDEFDGLIGIKGNPGSLIGSADKGVVVDDHDPVTQPPFFWLIPRNPEVTLFNLRCF